MIRANNEIVYYPLATPQDHRPLPRIAPPGPGGRPGRGTQPEDDPKPGSSTLHKDLTVISNPIHPDNNHQTIIQPSSPPDLIIKQDLKLPNVVFGNPLAKPKAPLQAYTSAVKPNETVQTKVQDVAAPQTPVTDQGLKFTALTPATAQPSLPVPLALTPGAARGASAAAAAGGITGDVNPGDPNGLLIMGTDPAVGGASISLPPGNKYGAFSISPAGGEPGSPGGVPGGGAGGTGGIGAGGDESAGIGSGKSGGGGGGLTIAAAPISVSERGGAGNHSSVDALLAGGEIFPVITPARVRRNSLVISAGGVGGGGLGIYKALQCGRIYTVFLPMPAATWTLQYCQQDDSQTKANPSASSRVVQLDEGLLPPDPIDKFDFRRLPVPVDDMRKMIVLKGIIRDDGVVDSLKIYQGVLQEMDQIALAAFSKWKFTPARRGGKSVPVQILVGIQLSDLVVH